MWAAPLEGCLKWNTDGSSVRKPGPSGVGGVLCDMNGVFQVCFSVNVGVMESNEAELSAVLFALELLVNNVDRLKRFNSVICELDSLVVMRWLNTAVWAPGNTIYCLTKFKIFCITFHQLQSVMCQGR